MNSRFAEKIKAFNVMYRLDTPAAPVLHRDVLDRLKKFAGILAEELKEVDEILNLIEDPNCTSTPEQVLANIADWLGDLQIYCASEMAKYGLDNDLVLDIIMTSNMSKLGADGKPIYREDGKVMKGPNFWPPEPQLHRYILAEKRLAESQQQLPL